MQWVWPPFLIAGIFFAPESPWWLVRKGRMEDAKRSLLRLTSRNGETDFDADETIAMIAHTTAIEEKVSTSHGSRPTSTDLRETRPRQGLRISIASEDMIYEGQRCALIAPSCSLAKPRLLRDHALGLRVTGDRLYDLGHSKSQWKLVLELFYVSSTAFITMPEP